MPKLNGDTLKFQEGRSFQLFLNFKKEVATQPNIPIRKDSFQLGEPAAVLI
ncbi:hypothetical protein [Marinilabilia salmonicolor]|uniref:hypothetical protein n=1 Tax=Marinilabilia salmonicolor TaxID=989 RepID=UPI00131F2A06|nr:hypothetical protein [Marinilabilia salmonicolor]